MYYYTSVALLLKTTKIPQSVHIQNPIRNLIERGKIDTPNTQTHDRLIAMLVTGTSIESQWLKRT
jgi:hypothetical protein